MVAERLGQSQVNRSALKALRYAWTERRLVLFLGAGVSLEWGIPTWKNLVLELLFEQTAEARRMRDLWPHYRRALAEWLTDYFDYDPVILARVVKNDIRKRASRRAGAAALGPTEGERQFLGMVRDHLYAGYRKARPPVTRRQHTSLAAVTDLLRRSAGHIPAVVTFNFDDLLEQALRDQRVPHYTVSRGGRARGEGIPIIHPHGFLPQVGDLPPDGIVFTEDDYHRLTDSTFHWALTTIVGHLRQYTVLFLGLSMSDPNLRRLLDASRFRGERPAHWQVQKRHEIRDHEKGRVMDRVEDRARYYGRILGDAELKDKNQLSVAIDAVLRQADSYDRQLFEAMGVKTIWLDAYEDIPLLLRRIPERRRGAEASPKTSR